MWESQAVQAAELTSGSIKTRFAEAQNLCAVEWFDCADDAYCALPYFDCNTACAVNDVACAYNCYLAATPQSQIVINHFVLCACHACVGICPSG